MIVLYLYVQYRSVIVLYLYVQYRSVIVLYLYVQYRSVIVLYLYVQYRSVIVLYLYVQYRSVIVLYLYVQYRSVIVLYLYVQYRSVIVRMCVVPSKKEWRSVENLLHSKGRVLPALPAVYQRSYSLHGNLSLTGNYNYRCLCFTNFLMYIHTYILSPIEYTYVYTQLLYIVLIMYDSRLSGVLMYYK